MPQTIEPFKQLKGQFALLSRETFKELFAGLSGSDTRIFKGSTQREIRLQPRKYFKGQPHKQSGFRQAEN
jgi:hypothetical protein